MWVLKMSSSIFFSFVSEFACWLVRTNFEVLIMEHGSVFKMARFFFVLKNICRLHLFFSTETQKERVAGNAVPICAFYKRTIA
jgi:hypothetical protein